MSIERRHMPDANRLSVLLAAVLLSYALAQLIKREQYAVDFQLFGIDFSFAFEPTSLAILLAAGLTASGVDWLLRGHPQYDGRRTFQHWILPALTALVLGVPLYNLSPGPLWWLGFSLGGVLLLLVLVAEYIALDSSDVRQPAASAGLMALSFALFVILASTLSHAGVRLTVIVLVIFPAAGMVTLRAIHLQDGTWDLPWSLTNAFILAQLAAALHYWPLEPVQYGLALLGPLYALTGLTINLREDVSPRRAGINALLGLTVFWAAAILLSG
jgi:hypothetical protein